MMYHIRSRKFLSFSPAAPMGKNLYPMNFLSCVNDNIEPMVIFTTWAKIYSAKYFCNNWVGLFFSLLSYKSFRLYSTCICTIRSTTSDSRNVHVHVHCTCTWHCLCTV